MVSAYECYLKNKGVFAKIYNTPKLNSMIEKADSCLHEAVQAARKTEYMKMNFPHSWAVSAAEKDLMLANNKLEAAAAKYNEFLCRQHAVQLKFEELNGIKRG